MGVNGMRTFVQVSILTGEEMLPEVWDVPGPAAATGRAGSLARAVLQALSLPLLPLWHPRICFLPSDLGQGYKRWFSMCGIPTVWQFLLLFPLLYPPIHMEGRAMSLEIKTHPNSPTKPRETLWKILFVTDYLMWLSTEQPPSMTLQSLVLPRHLGNLTLQFVNILIFAKPKNTISLKAYKSL